MDAVTHSKMVSGAKVTLHDTLRYECYYNEQPLDN